MWEAAVNVIIDNAKALAFWIDNIVYSFIPKLYELILYLANVNLYERSETVKALVSRIYILVGVFMLFKLSFSMIRYISDPNSFSDSSKGFTSLVRNVVICLALLVTIPWIFETGYRLQNLVLTKNVIPKLIMGSEMTSGDTLNVDSIKETAIDIQFLIFSPFYSLNYDLGVTEDNPNGPFIQCDPKKNENYALSNMIGTLDMARAGEPEGQCLKDFATKMDEEKANMGSPLSATNASISKMFKSDTTTREFSSLGTLLTWRIDGEPVIDYLPVISTICGGYFVFLLLSFCIDIGARAIKLLILQILSPIAVISTVDPTESSGNSKLKEWGSECLKTFLSLFLRLVVIFIIIQMIKIITEVIFVDPSKVYYEGGLPKSNTMNIFVFIFLVLGSFQAAKTIPNLIEKALGVKMSGELNLNPFKALGSNPLIAGAVGGITGGLIGAGASSIASGATALATGKGPLGAAMSAVGGLGAGAFRGAKGGYGKKFGDALKAGTHAGGISSRNMMMRNDLGVNWIKDPRGSARKQAEMTATRMLDTAGGPTPYQMWHSKVIRYDSVVEQADKLKKAASENARKSSAMAYDEKGKAMGKTWERAYQDAEDRAYQARIIYENSARTKADLLAYRTEVNNAETDKKNLDRQYYNKAINNQLTDYSTGTHIDDFDIVRGGSELDSRIKEAGLSGTSATLDEVKSVGKDAYMESEEIRNNKSYQELKKVHTTRENVSKENFYESGGR